MLSLIPGFEYDIFISYRQKDNKYDGWVTEFVDNLNKELEATFKEEISVYFDINPSDGLLETHDVNDSLKEKLKCLIFIPIISRTYCDPKSFAWEHEFKAFVDQASQDQFGLKVKLPNGNVANRVLPVRIHDLDQEDIKLCESVLGGVLRGIEFIYKEPGVNKPLTADDDEKKNLNNTKYRIQINKVANAIKEIVSGLKAEPLEKGKQEILQKEPIKEVIKEEKKEAEEKHVRLPKKKLLSGSIVITILLIAAILGYPKIFKRDTLEKLRSSGERISVAVMPFQNMTNDTTWNVWQDGIQNELINNLTNSEELRVRQIESITGLIQGKGLTNYASITPSVASTISQKLDANIFIYGSIKQADAIIRVNAQLIDSKTREAFKSFQIDGVPENILHIIDSLSGMIRNFLILSKLEKEVTPDFQHIASTDSPEAYKYFIFGKNAFLKTDYPTALNLLSKAVAIDSNFTVAIMQIAFAYGNQGLFKDAKKWSLKLYAKRNQMPPMQNILTNYTHAVFFETSYEVIKYLKQLLEFDDQSPVTHWSIGDVYNQLNQFDKSIPEFEKALEITNKWDTKPMWVYSYTSLGIAYHNTGQLTKEKELYRKAEKDFPDDPALIRRQSILSFAEEDTVAGNGYIEKLKTSLKEDSYSEAAIASNLAGIFSEADNPDEAEKYLRNALSLEPASPGRLFTLGYFLIDKDRDINEGLELVEKALQKNPDNYSYLHCKGWGLYKQGKYKEALDILQKSWDLRMKNAIYNYAAFLHLEEAKKAVASQK